MERKYDMKKINRGVFIAIFCVVAGLFTACGSSSPETIPSESSAVSSQSQVFTCVGEWEITGAKRNDIGIALDEILEEMGGEVSLTLKKDGSAQVVLGNSSMDATWSQNERTILLFMSNGEKLELKTVDQKLEMEWEGKVLLFEKK